MKKIRKLGKIGLETINDNVLLVGFILTSVLNDFILRSLTVGNIFRIRPIITSIALLLIYGVIAVLISGKRRNYLYVVFSGLFAILNAANYMYYSHFNSFISVGAISQSKHLSEMKNSVLQTLNIKVILFIIPTLIFYLFYKKLKKDGYFEHQDIEYSIKRELMSPFMAGVILLLITATTLNGTDISRLTKQWNREYLVEQFGIYTFSAADLIKAATVPRTIKADYGDFDKDIIALVNENKDKKQENKYTDILEGKDLYVIHYESVQNFAMDLEFDDGPATPFLNKLSNESLFFNNFYPQHSIGTSSDSELTFSTSLYPINNRTVFIDHADKEFSTLQKLLVDKGYYTVSMHGNNGDFWNREMMHPNLGYKDFISKKDYIIDEEVGLGLSDKSFYKQSVEKLKTIKETEKTPVMATLISLSHHYPFDQLDVYGDFDTGHLEGSEISNYLKSINYADQALEAFFIEMDEAGLLDNAAVLIYGDHHAKISETDFERLYNYDENSQTYKGKQDEDYIHMNNAYLRQVRKTPLLIWTNDKSLIEKNEEIIGMIDVMPMLANMLNIDNPYQLGNDIFNIEDNDVIFPDGSFINKDIYYSAAELKVYSTKDNELIMEEKDFDEEMLSKIEKNEAKLDLSSSIIENDLIQYYNNYFE